MPRRSQARRISALPVAESDWQTTVVDTASRGGWMHYHTHDSRHSVAGFPDLTLVRVPEIIYAELKTETGTVSAAQRLWLDALAACGAEVYVWRPSDFAEVSARLLQTSTPRRTS